MSRKHRNQHFRERQSFVFKKHRLPREFRQFVADKILPRLDIQGYKLDDKRRLTTHLIHNLVLTGAIGAVVSDTRDQYFPGVEFRVKLWTRSSAEVLRGSASGAKYRASRRGTGRQKSSWTSAALGDSDRG